MTRFRGCDRGQQNDQESVHLVTRGVGGSTVLLTIFRKAQVEVCIAKAPMAQSSRPPKYFSDHSSLKEGGHPVCFWEDPLSALLQSCSLSSPNRWILVSCTITATTVVNQSRPPSTGHHLFRKPVKKSFLGFFA